MATGQGFEIYVPAPTILFCGGGALSIVVPAPVIEFSGVGGFSITVPVPELAFTGVSSWGNLRIVVPLPILSFIGRSFGDLGIVVPHPIINFGIPGSTGEFRIIVPPPVISIATISIYGGGFSVSPPGSTIAFSGVLGNAGGFSVSPAAPQIIFAGYIKTDGGFILTAPAPLLVFDGYSYGLTKIFRGVSANLSHFGITEYTDFPFNSFASFNGKMLAAGGMTTKGIWSIEGKTDNGMPINIRVRTGTHDLFQRIMRRIRDVWITFRSDGQILFRFIPDESKEPIDRVVDSAGEMHEERVKPPRGLKNRFFTFEIQNVNGSDLDLESFTIDADDLDRGR